MNDSLMAIVPVKPFAEAKQRLAPVLADSARQALSRRLLGRTLLRLSRAECIVRTAVISRDPAALALARQYNAWSIVESEPDLNAALEQATRIAVANGARAVLVIPADLPRLRLRDIQKMCVLGERGPCVVLAPARRDGGTNALLVNPAGLIHYAFGPDSLAEHQRRALAAGARVEFYHSDTVALDLDLPDDWQMVRHILEPILPSSRAPASEHDQFPEL